jgi:hypothetical protein
VVLAAERPARDVASRAGSASDDGDEGLIVVYRESTGSVPETSTLLMRAAPVGARQKEPW